MGDEDRRHAEIMLQLGQKVHDLRLNRHVECGGGFIRDQKFGAAKKRHRDHHPLPHPAGKLMRVKPRATLGVGDLHRVQHADGLCHRLGLRHALVQRQHLRHLVGHPHIGVQRCHRVLKDHGDLVGADRVDGLARGVQNLLPVEADRSGGGAVLRQKPHDCEGKLRLARSAFADDAQRFALVEGQADAVDRADGAVGGREADGEVCDFQHRHVSGPSDRRHRAARHRRRRRRRA